MEVKVLPWKTLISVQLKEQKSTTKFLWVDRRKLLVENDSMTKSNEYLEEFLLR